MAQAAGRDRWNHTSALLALTANCHRDPKKGRAFKAADFHPHLARPRKRRLAKADITLLKTVFVDRPRDA